MTAGSALAEGGKQAAKPKSESKAAAALPAKVEAKTASATLSPQDTAAQLRAQAEVLGPKRKVSIAAVSKAKAAIKKQLRSTAAAVTRLRKAKKPHPARDSAALETARAAYAEATAQHKLLKRESKAQRDAEDELAKMTEAALTAAAMAKANAAAARQAATEAQKAAAAAKRGAQRVKALAALGAPAAFASKRAREDAELAALEQQLEVAKTELAATKAAAAPEAPAAASTPKLLDRLKGFKECDIKKVDWEKVDAACWAKADSGDADAFTVLGYADTNRNGRPEAFLDFHRYEFDEEAQAAGGSGTMRIRELEVYEADATCQLQLVSTLDLGAPYDKWRVTIVAEGVDVDGLLYGQQKNWKHRWTKRGLEEVAQGK